jgi:4-methylaminobutanoate oxidase (formaldehyde-forming)
MRESARAVIIGGGVGGTSIAYHLAHLGWTEVMLLDRAELTSGSTFHSAGLVGQLRSSVTLTKMMMYGTELYRRLHHETGYDPGWREVGSLRLASSRARMEELARQTGWAQTFGLPLELVSTADAHRLFHGLFDPAGVLGAVFLPTDGQLNPSGLALALADGARRRGVGIHTHTRVTGIGVVNGRVSHVDTDQGRIDCEVVVNAGGIYAHQLGNLARINVPVVPMAHQYAHTRPRVEIPHDLPTMRDPDRLVYFREEVGGLLMGGYERNPMPWHLDGRIPPDFNNRLLSPDWERFHPLSESAQTLVPVLAEAEVTELINGPEAFTPDGEFILGESEVGGLFVAAGFCAHGIAGAGGIGKVMAEWIVGREPPMDLWKMDIRRFGPQYRSRSYCLGRTDEIYSSYYDIVYPNHERIAGRPLRTSPVYGRHQSLRAAFGEKSGWERVNWYESNHDPDHERLRPRGWAGENWSTAIVTEHLATRRAAGLFDESSFAKIEVTGSLAGEFLQRMCANDVGKPPGRVTYTALLNSRGGIECDLTVTRLEEDRFLLVTGTAFGRHDLSWLLQHRPPGDGVAIRDVTASMACLGLW